MKKKFSQKRVRKRGCKREEAFDRRGFRRQRWHCRSEGSLRQMPGLLSIHSRASFAVTKATRFLFFFFFFLPESGVTGTLVSFSFFFFSVSNRSDWLAFRLSPSLVTTSDSLSSNSFQNNQRLTEFVSHPYLPQDIARLEENRIRNRGKQQRFLYIL